MISKTKDMIIFMRLSPELEITSLKAFPNKINAHVRWTLIRQRRVQFVVLITRS